MNFDQYLTLRNQRLAQVSQDLGETNLYARMMRFRVQPQTFPPSPQTPFYRCDLARLWLKRYNFPSSHSRNALICQGVRHALQLLFQHFAQANLTAAIPQDVYPVYTRLAQSANISIIPYPTLPKVQWPHEMETRQIQILLICNPWKPLGTFLHPTDLIHIQTWLTANPARKVLIDSVYDFTPNFHSTTRELLASGQAILLHSIAKSWLWPKTFGVAYSPSHETHTPPWTHSFLQASPSQAQLAIAFHCLNDATHIPSLLTHELKLMAEDCVHSLPHPIQSALLHPPVQLAPGNYLFPVNLPSEDLWSRHKIMGLPASVFGSPWPGTILSSLNHR